jgi:restriction endonuclease S subunit
LSDFSAPYVIWGIDGDFKFRAMPTGTKFATTDHCGAVQILNPLIDPQYLAYALEQAKHLYGFDRGLRASLTNMKKVEISIPFDENGDFDLQAQQRFATVFSFINEVREELQLKYCELESCIISATIDGYTMREYPLNDILAPIKGKSMYTKRYGETNKGDYPVYSASANRPLTYIDTYDFCGTYLSWSTNGFAGTVSILTDRFSINGDRGILLPKREDIDIHYLRYILHPLFRKMAKGRIGDHGSDEFTKLYPSMIANVHIPLPVNENCEISLMAQQEIAAIYAVIEQYKREVLEKLKLLIMQKVEL